jgi:nicotinamide-nucleotide amidase
VATAESCTAGWVAKALTDVPGSSRWVEAGYVVYSNAAKMRDLKVSMATLRRHGAVSRATVLEMARGAVLATGADLAVAISGIAGPDGGTMEKPVGTVWFAIAGRQRAVRAGATVKVFSGDREAVRRKSVAFALQLIRQRAAP